MSMRAAISLRGQRGAALIVGLIVVGVLLILSAAAITVANTQFKVSGNVQYHSLAMTGAESAIATAENWLNTNYANSAFNAASVPGLYPSNALIDPLTMQWNDSNSIKIDSA